MIYQQIINIIMKKILIIFAISILLIETGCTKKENKELKDSNSAKTVKSEIQYNQDSTLRFANINWIPLEGEGSINDDIIPAKASNVFVDDAGRLHLKMVKMHGGFYGAEIIADTLFDLGEFTFEIDTDMSKISKNTNSELRFRLINPSSTIRKGIVETGISLGYENSKQYPLKFYSINTNSENIEKYYYSKPLNNSKSKFKIVMVKDAISYIYCGNSNSHILEYTISKYNKNTELTYFQPATKQKLVLSAYYFDGGERADEFEIIISNIKIKSIFDKGSNNNLAKK